MSEEYRQMWKDIGLDLDGHDALLSALSQGYQDIYLAQDTSLKLPHGCAQLETAFHY